MLEVRAPMAGHSLAVSDVPDPVFARGLVGPGLAIEPRGGVQTVVAPISGIVVKLHPHAFVVLSDDGLGVLVHLGIDTVRMQGKGFEVLVDEGDRVEAGDPMVTWDPCQVQHSGRSPMCAVVVLNGDPGDIEKYVVNADVEKGEPLFEVAPAG